MRAHLARRRTMTASWIAASAALLAACGSNATPPPTTQTASPTPATAPPVLRLDRGTLLISNGTATVNVGGVDVTFPTTVTDAAWSHDGSRIAFVDADGNIATARPDGTGLVALTKRRDGVARSEPTWMDGSVVFTEKAASGKVRLRMIPSNGTAEAETDGFVADDGQGNIAPGSAADVVPSGRGQEVAFQVNGAGGPELWVEDLNVRAPWPVKLTSGREPALSPDGAKVAFVDRSGQVSIIDSGGAGRPVRITTGVTSPTRITWTPDGKEVVFRTPTSIEAAPATGSGPGSGPTRQVSPTTGVPTYLAAPRDAVSRLTARDPVALAVAASRSTWPTVRRYIVSENSRNAYAATLLSTADLPTALVGAARNGGGPVLLTAAGALDARTSSELRRVFGTAGIDRPMVTLIGDTTLISSGVERAVRSLGYDTRRVSGRDRYAIAAALAGDPAGYVEHVYVLDGGDPVALAAAGSGGEISQSTVLLSRGSALPDSAKAYITRMPAEVTLYAVGPAARAAVGASGWRGKVVAITTPQAMLERFGSAADTVIVAPQSSMEDLVVAAGLRGRYRTAQLLAVDAGADIGTEARAWLDLSSAQIDRTVIVDGRSAIGQRVEATIGNLVCGPLGFLAYSNPTMKS